MGKIFITGDTHNSLDISKLNSDNFPEGKTLNKNDYLIICGDFGLVWSNDKHDLYWQEWLADKPWTTLFIDGNHENFDLLEKYPVIDKFGDKVSKINDSIYWLRRGNIYTLHNKTFFTFGGANSIDKIQRIHGVTWWPQEIPNNTELDRGLRALNSVNWQVDYILTHTAPQSVLQNIIRQVGSHYKEYDMAEIGLRKYFDHIKATVSYKHWFFGHFHVDFEGKKHTALYTNIIKIGG